MRALLFSGTSDGSRLSRCLAGRGWEVTVCTATEYGEKVTCHQPNIEVRSGRLDQAGIEELIRSLPFSVVIDATHPYAAAASGNIRAACAATKVEYLRLLRDTQRSDGVVEVDTTEAAADFLNTVSGNVLLTTGSKELAAYTKVKDYRTRLYARVLSTEESVQKCRTLGFEGKNLIAMQGPFSEELNLAMLRQIRAQWMVTKASGSAGGFAEKLAAARQAGVGVVVIRRPVEETGLSLREITERLTGAPEDLEVALVGIGMGGRSGMTQEAVDALDAAEALIGAGRMLEAVAGFGGEMVSEYKAERIVDYILTSGRSRFAVVLSGDVGFYSGAKRLRELLEGQSHVQVKTVCGVSSVAYLCAALGTAWEDAALVSMHGRRNNLIGAVRRYPKVFAIAGDNVSALLESLCACGLGAVRVAVGSNLSYENEQICRGTAETLRGETFPALSCLLIENDRASRMPVTHGLPDGAFLRGEVPMTKEEIRSVSLSKLRLTEDAVVYDIGAGTGSVSVEAAMQAWRGRVYAVERKDVACRLIEENCRRLGAENVELTPGHAPEALEDLPAPTHVFIGGSGGTMAETISCVLQKNPSVRVVINAIALDTVAEVLAFSKLQPLAGLEIVQITTAKSKTVAGYHMMNGGNPVYVISFGGGEEA